MSTPSQTIQLRSELDLKDILIIMFHTLGKVHEHRRRDRDHHVKIQRENVLRGRSRVN